MRFTFDRDDSLPRLAWCARVERGSKEVHVRHGPWVETGEEFFFEGAWSGAFSGGKPSAAVAAFGSGAELGEKGGPERVRFVTPTHMLERLHMMQLADAIIVSNSLPFTLAEAGDTVDEQYKFYHFDLMTNMRGYRRYKPSVRTRGGRELRVFFHTNIVVRPDLSVELEEKQLPPQFRDYDHYLGYLRGAIRQIQENAADPGRVRQYPPLATISSGYDSPAVALLAREVGCTEAITFGKARPGYAEEDDSGQAIARVLGMEVLEFDRLAYRSLDCFPEAEFLAYGAGGEEVVFAPLEDVLSRRTLYTGYLGDAVWSRVTRRVNTELLMLYPGGSSLGEFRLRVGFIHFPVPTIGYIRHPSIHAISNSEPLRPWALGNDYDRPIPRRLLEEVGVPRHAFGRTKKAITQPLWNTDALGTIFTRRSYADFREFAATVPMYGGAAERARFRAMRLAYELNLRINWRLQRLARRFGRFVDERPLISERYSQDRGPSALTFHWGVLKLLDRYRPSSAREAAEQQAR